ncbi:MAG TPA: selenoneine synthase SenA [Albitalea sp.]|nr:selenoneine synthase SenA [Albitalea sp.]
MMDLASADVDSPQMRRAGRDLLSLALMDARNHTLRWIGVFEQSLAAREFVVPLRPELLPPLWLLGHVGWFQEYWVGRNVQRQRGADADPAGPRLASIDPHADRCHDPAQSSHEQRWQLELPGLHDTKQYLAETMDITLELLEGADDSDAALYFFRLALMHEDMQCETFAEMAQTLDLKLGDATALLSDVPSVATREPLLFPATRWRLGSLPGGFVFDNEKWSHEVEVPEFDIDAQPVSWAQFAEFIEDGGYDEPSFWSPAGLDWLRTEGRRVPRHVDQLRRGVLQRRFGRLTRVPLSQPVMHVSWYEAEAWCRWAGRRLPAEVEWEAAAHAYSRGFAWGSVWEWTAGTFHPYPGFGPDPWSACSQPYFGRRKVLRGASAATRPRLRHPKFRRCARPERDDLFCGFRSCGI